MGANDIDGRNSQAYAMSTVRWRIFLLILLVVSINYVDRASLSVAMPIIAKQFDLTAGMQGVLLSAFFWSYTLMQVPGGWLADRFRPRIIVGAATILWGISQAATAAVTGWTGLLLARIGLGLAEGPIYPASGKLNAIWLPASERARGAVIIDGGAPLGTAFGSLIIATLIGSLNSWRLAFLIAGLGTVAAGVLAYRYIRNSPREHPGVNPAELEHIQSGHAREDAQTSSPERPKAPEASKASATSPGSVRRFLRSRSFWGMVLGWLGFDLVFYGLVSWGPSYLAQARHLSLASAGGSLFIIFGAGFLGEMLGGFLADRWKARGGSPNRVMRTLLGVSGALTTLSTFALAFVSSAGAAVALLASTLFFLRWAGLYWSLPATLGERRHAGLLGGIMNAAGNLGGIVVPIVVGAIVQRTGDYFAALIFFAACGGMYTISSLMIDYSRRCA